MDEVVLDSPVTDDASSANDDVQAVDDAQEVEADAAPADGEQDSQETQEDAPTDKGDGRALPKQVQAALKQLRETNPDLAKISGQLRDAYFRDVALGKSFPKGINEAIALKTSMEALGGQEGVAALQERAGILDTISANIHAGDRSVAEDMFTDAPEGAVKITGHLMEMLQSKNFEAYANIARPIVVAGLEQAGFVETMGEIAESIKNGNTQAAMQRLNQIGQWFGGVKAAADKAKTSQVDPERQKLQDDRQSFEKEKYDGYVKSVFSEFDAHRTAAIDKDLAPYLKGKNLSKEAVSDLHEGIVKELSRLMSADKVYSTNVRGIMRQNDKTKSVSYINAKIDELHSQAVKTVWTRRYGTIPATTKPAVKGVNQGRKNPTTDKPAAEAPKAGPAVLVNRAFKRDELDRTKDPNGVLFMVNKGYPKSGSFKGRLVSWK